jgi:hypothetical protein
LPVLGFSGALLAAAAPPNARHEDDLATLVITVLEKRQQHAAEPSRHAVVRVVETSIERQTNDQGEARLPGIKAGLTVLQVMVESAAETCVHTMTLKPGTQKLQLIVPLPSGKCEPAAPAAAHNEARNHASPSPKRTGLFGDD